eukprot:765486-Hanusia_phi.AAC.1
MGHFACRVNTYPSSSSPTFLPTRNSQHSELIEHFRQKYLELSRLKSPAILWDFGIACAHLAWLVPTLTVSGIADSTAHELAVRLTKDSNGFQCARTLFGYSSSAPSSTVCSAIAPVHSSTVCSAIAPVCTVEHCLFGYSSSALEH